MSIREVRVSGQPSQPVTELLTSWRAGDPAALEALIPVVYDELHRLAHHYLRGERRGHTLQSTALVNEAYLRLVSQGPGQIGDRAHFIGVAAHLMRQILVDYARAQHAAKRDGGRRIALEEALHPLQVEDVDVIDLDKALKGLEQLDEKQSRIVELRFFGGLSIEDTATLIGLSPATVKREWAMAKAWLSRELGTPGT
ncbi:MAG TPA: sigma-70 family RNA polymerase sigma factor [Steroidobacteraceae bacterium]|nr:sigma-70 family RNA polymerase sigma factor [Steroidobacteraceae bacterium]